MKKRIISALVLLVLVVTLAGSVLADAQLSYVTDTTALLTADECQKLEKKAQAISEQYSCGVYLIIVDNYTEYAGSENGMYEFAKYLYRNYELGLGSDRSGELLVMSMNDRKYGLIAYGSVGNGAFTDYGKECLEDAFTAEFRVDDWMGGFETYLSVSESYLHQYSQGTPFDSTGSRNSGSSRSGFNLSGLVSALFMGALIAAVVCLIQKKKMKTAVLQTNANAYVVPGSVALRLCTDQYTHTTRQVTKISRDNDHGGGTTVDSDGFSGGSGSF